MMMLSSLLFVAVVGSSSAFLIDFDRSWDGLRVHWGFNIFSSNNFVHMPRNTEDAVKQGFTKISDCDEKATWRGARYIKNDDYVLVLLFDKNGYIAGIQTQLPSGLPKGYPKTNIQPPFIKNGDNYTLTAYFVDPATICSTGRTSADLTGTDLYIQNGNNPVKNKMWIPRDESGLAKTKWVKGKCFVSMGQHYWYNITENMSCDDFFPVFLMYNSDKLTGFGWAMGADLESNRVEHPSSSSLNFFFKDVPKCLKEDGNKFSTMHIYLTSSIVTNAC